MTLPVLDWSLNNKSTEHSNTHSTKKKNQNPRTKLNWVNKLWRKDTNVQREHTKSAAVQSGKHHRLHLPPCVLYINHLQHFIAAVRERIWLRSNAPPSAACRAFPGEPKVLNTHQKVLIRRYLMPRCTFFFDALLPRLFYSIRFAPHPTLISNPLVTRQ